MQTCLEKHGIDARNDQIVRNDYTKVDEYSALHPDAISDGDPLGKGTGHGGHTHDIPDCNRGKGIDYRNFDTFGNPGGLYDIEGRNGVGGREFLMNISKYGPEREYSANNISTIMNVADGQIIVY